MWRFGTKLFLKVGHGWPVLLCADGYAPWLTQVGHRWPGLPLREWMRAKKITHAKTTKARSWRAFVAYFS